MTFTFNLDFYNNRIKGTGDMQGNTLRIAYGDTEVTYDMTAFDEVR